MTRIGLCKTPISISTCPNTSCAIRCAGPHGLGSKQIITQQPGTIVEIPFSQGLTQNCSLLIHLVNGLEYNTQIPLTLAVFGGR